VTASWRFARREPVLLLLVALAATAYSLVAVLRHVRYGSHGYDLAIQAQAVWHYSRFEAPESSLLYLDNLLGDHFAPITALMAPLYWFWADPRMLLIGQGLLVAASIVPVYLFCRSRVGRIGAYGYAAGYALSWPLASGVNFDWHEVAFAPLLVALVVLFADRERWRAFWITFALLLAVKENLAVFGMALGLWLALRGEGRRALIALAVSAVYFLVVTKLVIPHLAAGADYNHWTYTQFGTDLPDALVTVAQDPARVVHYLIDSPVKIKTMAYLLVPFLMSALYSSLLVLMVPLILQELLSIDPLFWGTGFHHWMIIAPLLPMAAADGLRNVMTLTGRRDLLPAVGAAAGLVILLGNFTLADRFPLAQLKVRQYYDVGLGFDGIAARAVAKVPGGASVAAQDNMTPHLADRDEIYEISEGMPAVDYIVADLGGLGGYSFPLGYDGIRAVVAARRARYETVHEEQGVVVLRRRDLPTER